jgi:hypothetical protein
MTTPQMIYWCRAKTAYQKTAPALSPRWGRFFGPPPRNESRYGVTSCVLGSSIWPTHTFAR